MTWITSSFLRQILSASSVLFLPFRHLQASFLQLTASSLQIQKPKPFHSLVRPQKTTLEWLCAKSRQSSLQAMKARARKLTAKSKSQSKAIQIKYGEMFLVLAATMTRQKKQTNGLSLQPSVRVTITSRPKKKACNMLTKLQSR